MEIIFKQNPKRRHLIVCMLWSWWMCRNKANAGEGSLSVEEVTRRAVLFADCFFQLEDNTTGPANQGRRAKSRWMPPPRDVLKINTDAAFREAEKDGAWGYVIRDCNGHGVMAGSGRLKWVHDALSAEGEAYLEALKAAMEEGISRVAIETDSANLVAAIMTNRFDQAPGGVLFREIRVLLSLHFVTLSFSHVSRNCNGCAHELACSGLQRDPDHL